MPEMVASHSSQRVAAWLDFQRDVDLQNPSHTGENLGPRHHHGEQSWSVSVSSFLQSTFKASKLEVDRAVPSPRQGGVLGAAVARSHGQFSPQLFIRNALKRALFSRDEFKVVDVKRARFDEYGSAAQPMVKHYNKRLHMGAGGSDLGAVTQKCARALSNCSNRDPTKQQFWTANPRESLVNFLLTRYGRPGSTRSNPVYLTHPFVKDGRAVVLGKTGLNHKYAKAKLQSSPFWEMELLEGMQLMKVLKVFIPGAKVMFPTKQRNKAVKILGDVINTRYAKDATLV